MDPEAMEGRSMKRRRAAMRAVVAVVLALALGSIAPRSMAEGSWWNAEWAYRKQIVLNVPASPQAPSGVPVLVRLHEGVLNFADAAPDGADLRFVAEDDKTPLKFHIESFDANFNMGFVWVQVPLLAPGTPQRIWMYYGNPKAAAGGEAEGTYEREKVMVWRSGG